MSQIKKVVVVSILIKKKNGGSVGDFSRIGIDISRAFFKLFLTEKKPMDLHDIQGRFWSP
jgi:hypothetical protein